MTSPLVEARLRALVEKWRSSADSLRGHMQNWMDVRTSQAIEKEAMLLEVRARELETALLRDLSQAEPVELRAYVPGLVWLLTHLDKRHTVTMEQTGQAFECLTCNNDISMRLAFGASTDDVLEALLAAPPALEGQ